MRIANWIIWPALTLFIMVNSGAAQFVHICEHHCGHVESETPRQEEETPGHHHGSHDCQICQTFMSLTKVVITGLPLIVSVEMPVIETGDLKIYPIQSQAESVTSTRGPPILSSLSG